MLLINAPHVTAVTLPLLLVIAVVALVVVRQKRNQAHDHDAEFRALRDRLRRPWWRRF